MEITVLCKVVDNFGDVGVTFRMILRLKKINPQLKINYVIDDLDSLKKICSEIDSTRNFQKYKDVEIYNWKAFDFCYEAFFKNDGEKLSVILECFQCGRPDWMEKILFETKLNRTVNIIMIDYLTAEKYADDFHKLKSLTRSAKVQKVNFMPGFTEKTGGLIIDDEWKEIPERNCSGPVLVFTYERNWNPFVRALKKSSCGSRTVLIGSGRGQKTMVQAFEAAGDLKSSVIKCAADGIKNEKITAGTLNADYCKSGYVYALPYMNLTQWDKMMKNCSVLVIRGEETMSRACLSGIPFIWHAYPQSDEYQMVKVNALLDRMERHFLSEDFKIVKNAWQCFNMDEKQVPDEKFELYLRNFFDNAERITYGFKDFALNLEKNGDLCSNLMTFIEKLTII